MSVKSPPARRLALLICNGHFEHMQEFSLLGPVEDAKRLAAVLSNEETCRFSVQVLVDRGLLEVRREIARICSDACEDDTLLIYYSGTGMQDESGSLCLALADVDRDFVDATALDSEFVVSRLRRSKCRKTVLLIDCCHAGAFFNNNRGIPDGLYAITSCGASQFCADTEQGGAFTVALCAGLSGALADTDGDGRVSIDELHDFVRAHLHVNNFEMTPQKWVWNVPEPIYLANVQRHVFISYAHEDAEAAAALGKALEERGLAVWIDNEGILSGSWKERVTNGLNGARAVVMLLTTKSLESEAVQKELSFAAIKKVPIIPVQFKEIPTDRLKDWFALDYGELHRHLLDAKNYAAKVNLLVTAISKLRNISASKPVTPAPRRKGQQRSR